MWASVKTGMKKMGNSLEALKKFLRDFFFGAAYLEFEQAAGQEKLVRQDLFRLLSFEDLLGVPVFPPYYSLRLFPFFYPSVDSWKKRMLKERDLTEVKSL